MKVWLNGQFVDRDSATISVHDAAPQHGIGLFETMLARGGRVYRLREHLHRLAGSARDLRLTEKLRVRPLGEAVELALLENNLNEARVRLTITGGDLNLLQSKRESPATPTIIIVAQPPTHYPHELFERGVRVAIADGRLNPFDPFTGHKTINYWSRLRAVQDAGAAGCSEAIWFSVTNHVMSGSVSNLFIVRNGALITPIARGEEPEGGLHAPVLPGVTRAAMIELAREANLAVSKSMIDIDMLLGADELFLTNSSWGVLPVGTITFGEQVETIGSGRPGKITAHLRARYEADVIERTIRVPEIEIESSGETPDSE